MNRWELRRRDFLTALGVGMGCLPTFHSSKIWAAGTGAPKKLLIVINSEGYQQGAWRPKDGSLTTQTLPSSSSPMEAHKANLLYMIGLTHPTFTGNQHGAFTNHLAAGTNSGTGEYRMPYTATIDQVIGPALAKTNTLPRATLNLSVLSAQGTQGDNNSKICTYKGKDQAVTPEQDPFKTWGQIFGSSTGTTTTSGQTATTKLMAEQKSILDFVGADLETFSARMGSDYKVIAGGHLAAIRDLEKQLQTVMPGTTTTAGQCGPLPASTQVVSATNSANYAALLKIQMDLAVAALQCDVTRVVTLQVADSGGSHIPFNFVQGVSGQALDPSTFKPVAGQRSWHDLSHSPVTDGVDMKALVDKWFMGQFASLLDRVKAVTEPGGTMLNNSVVLITNHMEEGLNHNCQKLPWMLAGTLQGYFKNGQCINGSNKPINGVLANICNGMDVPVTYFGDANVGKPWTDILA